MKRKEYLPSPDEIKEETRKLREKHLKAKAESRYSDGPTVPRLFLHQPKVKVVYNRFYDW
tara:strand:- start:519 stop:698 length:180 start_codon:yes stop_codon:yes gene_type:complete